MINLGLDKIHPYDCPVTRVINDHLAANAKLLPNGVALRCATFEEIATIKVIAAIVSPGTKAKLPNGKEFMAIPITIPATTKLKKLTKADFIQFHQWVTPS